ncbi:S-layer family protein [Orenia metallireducens]|jgi:chromosome segregation ATPase|uniref:S-layer homology domain-containing protein n=1 Tax=Orenia metallireducens TaxID=1413210 RepID=A0A285GPW5_9FIRM|nr:S-layer homology domain-containing protein [Orenia metallireducens]PRX29890.1 S-layer family protein [Orenia metallireducens]SNY25515.1 S-layer homology domain-containing protein [Orenia metallireducens]
MKVRNSFINFMLIFIFVATAALPAFAATKIDDISSSHWAYKSVKELVEKGYMSLYEGNEFKGENKVSRYELAKVIAKILNNIEQGQVVPEKGDVLTLKNLASEFRSELVEVISQNEDLKDEVNKLDKEQKVLKEDVVNTNYRINQLQQEVVKLLKSLKEEAERTKKLENKLSSLEQDNQVLKERLAKLEEGSGTQQEIDKLKKNIYWLTGGLIISLLLSVSN